MGCEYPNPQTSQTPASHEGGNIVTIGDQSWEVEIANTPEARQMGLMGREKLEKGEGMLFVFDRENLHGFWMKNTLIPLDVIWISADKKVVDAQTLFPCKEEVCPGFLPKYPAQYVLEVNAGEFKRKVGDNVDF